MGICTWCRCFFTLLPAFCAGSNFCWPPTASLHICFWGLCFKCWHIEVDNKAHEGGAEPCPWKPLLSHSSAFWCGYGLVMKCFCCKARGSREPGHPWQAGSRPCWGLAQQALHSRESLACAQFLFATSPLPEFQEKKIYFKGALLIAEVLLACYVLAFFLGSYKDKPRENGKNDPAQESSYIFWRPLLLQLELSLLVVPHH